MEGLVPPMAMEGDAGAIMSMGENTKNSMLLTLIVPLGFMIFMSISMDRVWSMYLMLQIVGNFVNLNCLQRPGNVEYVLFMAKKVSDFKIAEEPNVRNWAKQYIFKNLEYLQFLTLGQGSYLLALEFLIVIVLLIKLIQKIKQDGKLTKAIKRKIMWSSFFRGQIQFYFPVTLLVLTTL